MTSYGPHSAVVTPVLSCRISEILELLYAESHCFHSIPHPYSAKNFGSVPFGSTMLPMLGSPKSEHPNEIIKREIIFQEFQPI